MLVNCPMLAVGINNVPRFYRELFLSESLIHACKMLGDDFHYFHSATFLFQILTRYFREQCKGVGGRNRKEELLTQVMQTSLGEYSEQISTYRSQIKQYIAPSQKILDSYTSRFLMGMASGIKIEDLLAEIDNA